MSEENNQPEQSNVPAVFPVKRVLLEHGDHRARQTADIFRHTTAADLLARVELKADGKHLVLDRNGEPLPPDMGVYGEFESGQVVQIVRHPDHPRQGPLPHLPTIGSHE